MGVGAGKRSPPPPLPRPPVFAVAFVRTVTLAMQAIPAGVSEGFVSVSYSNLTNCNVIILSFLSLPPRQANAIRV